MSADAPEYRVKNFESLYALSNQLFEDERERFADAERKLERFWTFLVATAGAGTFVLTTAEVPLRIPSTWQEALIAILLSVFYVVILAGLGASIYGMRVSRFPALPVSAALPQFYLDNTYVTTLYAMSKRNFEGAEKAHAVNERKMRVVFHVSNCLALAIATGVITFLLISIDKLEGTSMEDHDTSVEVTADGGGGGGGDDSSTPDTPLHEPDPGVEAPELDDETRAEPDLSVDAPGLVRIEKGE